TSERAKMKVLELLGTVAACSSPITCFVVPFTRIQEEIRKNCPEELFTIIMRRIMMEIATRLAESEGCQALVTGESVGQVASQTMEALFCTDAAAGMPVFRPLIGMDKDEIVRIARKIGTFEISIQPYEDCCTVFTPKHPRTKPVLKYVEAAQNAFDFGPLIDEAAAGAERMRIVG
ncbi:MAG TPA: tRNA 4-thiouridine(8) synthase ThiI, partial [Clostridia bacterium]|nr:tRNA 4-thiouridine(8) synthase ThiI [Clostridia bacterium]